MKLYIEKGEESVTVEADAVPRVGEYVETTNVAGYVRAVLWGIKGKKLEAHVRLDR